jgi:hypothetical protein
MCADAVPELSLTWPPCASARGWSERHVHRSGSDWNRQSTCGVCGSVKSNLVTGSLLLLLMPPLLTACQLVGPTQPAPPSSVRDPGALTCDGWLGITDLERVAVADRLVGDSADLLERIRLRQHAPEGTPRDTLIRDVVTSLTKNCEVWPPRERPVGEVMDALYDSPADAPPRF